MKKTSSKKIFGRVLALFAMLCIVGILATACANGSKLMAQQKQIHEQTQQIHDRAYRCAPYELAMAMAHEEFGRMELSDGNGRRANDHIPYANDMLNEADAKSLHTLCQDPRTQDRDGDGIIDMEDKCPDTPGLKAYDGCPNPDSDGDGVCDIWVSEMGLLGEFDCKGIDYCPDEPGELAYSGCNNPDSDGDGLCDQWVAKAGLEDTFATTCKGSDLCEDIRGTEEFFGCPNPDSDGDGVCDPWVSERGLLDRFDCVGVDKCPFEKGSIEDNGCPPPRKYIVVTDTKIELKEQFFFATNKTKVLSKSVPLLDEIADVLKENASIHISIEGHTDSSGRRSHNVRLSKGRAMSVMQELLKRGIDKERMVSTGFGPDRPIDTNDTVEGRANNRRVELEITQR